MIPFIDFGGTGLPVVLAPANGYPPGAYRPLIAELTPCHHVAALLLRPLWPDAGPAALRDWQPFVRDLIQLIEQGGRGPVIGVGHSIGAVVALAAALRRPELFAAVVMLDPVLFRRRLLFAWNLAKRLGLAQQAHPLISATLRRRRTFESLEAMFAQYRRAQIFARMNDAQLSAYVDSLARPRPDGQIELAYPPEWEAAIYTAGPLDLWREMPQLRPPLLAIRGEHTDAFSAGAARKLQRHLPRARLVTVPDASHLVPLEKPEAVAQIIEAFLKAHLRRDT